MFSKIVETIPGITTLPIIVTILFFLTFIGIIIWVVRANKDYLKRMSELPLDSSTKNGE